MGTDSPLEVEVKFYLTDLQQFERRLQAAGAVLSIPRVFERNIRYDNAWDGLMRKRQLLRLRQDNRVRITFKGDPPQSVHAAEAKIREELEIEVDDFAMADALIKRIGFEAKQVYEKYRTTYQLGDVEIVLDEMPYGNFIELEGPLEALKSVATLLELNWEERLLTNYLALMSLMTKRFDLAFSDLTFANFTTVDVTVADLLPLS